MESDDGSTSGGRDTEEGEENDMKAEISRPPAIIDKEDALATEVFHPINDVPYRPTEDHDSKRVLQKVVQTSEVLEATKNWRYMEDASGKLARWRLRLQEVKFDIVHLPGIKHQAEWHTLDQTLM